MRKQPEKTGQTKENLRTAFWELYKEKPIEKITIKEITVAAGYNRGTFYLYYKDVYDIFTQIEEELLEAIRELIDETLLRDEQLNLTQHMGLILEMTRRYSDYVSVLMSDRGDPAFVTRLKALIWPLLDSYFLGDQGHSPQELALLSEFYLSGLLSAIAKWLNDPEDMTIDQFINFIMKNVFMALFPTRGL